MARINLREMAVNQRGLIACIKADGELGRRIRDMGLVPGTERGERWFLWVSGVPEPGAMRQHHRHATAFVGRRHFDDPYLLERIYRWDKE